MKLITLFLSLLMLRCTVMSSQVKIRIFADRSPETAIFSVAEGNYCITFSDGREIKIIKDESVAITKFNGRLAVKCRKSAGFICDSLIITAKTGNDIFSLMMNDNVHLRQYYSGDFKCFPDLGTMVLVNISDNEKYVAGVVKAEGGNGKNSEYFKSQAIIARTYLYKYFDKHLTDRYNLCDNTHCQAFNGLSSDSLVNTAVQATGGLVILDKDSILIISAFHSNCGGETASSEDVWLSGQPYLKSVTDPYCSGSRNSTWRKSFPGTEWVNYLRKAGYNGLSGDLSVFNFAQESRTSGYKSGSFTMPLRTLRTDLSLRSAFFSVTAIGDSVILKGRGYGHGVGLCQEGAMVMGAKGFTYNDIIKYYYSGVIISDIKNAVVLH